MVNSLSSTSVALITGGATRIGKAICVYLAQKGFKIAIHYNHSQTQAKETLTEIEDSGGVAHLFKVDLGNENHVKKLIHDVTSKMGPISLLINNASIFEKSSFKEGDIKSLNHHWAINLKAPYILSQAFALQTSQGQIINILDTKITKNSTLYFNYLLSKKSLENLTQMSALELSPKIRVNAIAPGLILPPAGKKDTYLDKLSLNIPLKRKGNIQNILKTVSFLLDNDFITGQVIYVDGGNHLQ